MATIICPNCGEDSFVWSIDEQESPLTRWGCYKCYYVAFEDESFERECSGCKAISEIRLEDEQGKYWWCHKCKRKTDI